jgi:hypothetical protein
VSEHCQGQPHRIYSIFRLCSLDRSLNFSDWQHVWAANFVTWHETGTWQHAVASKDTVLVSFSLQRTIAVFNQCNMRQHAMHINIYY